MNKFFGVGQSDSEDKGCDDDDDDENEVNDCNSVNNHSNTEGHEKQQADTGDDKRGDHEEEVKWKCVKTYSSVGMRMQPD